MGYQLGGIITNSYVSGNVGGTSLDSLVPISPSTKTVGGLVGKQQDGIIANSYAM